MKKNYSCKNYDDCEYADNFEIFELDEHELKCPKCGREDTLDEQNSPKLNPLLNIFKNSLVIGIIGGIVLLGGGVYYCFSGDSICFGKKTDNIEKNSSTQKTLARATDNIKNPIGPKSDVKVKEPVQIEKPIKEKKERLVEEKAKKEAQIKIKKSRQQADLEKQKELEKQLKREAELKKQKEDKEKNRTYFLRVIRTPSNAKVKILKVKPSYDYNQDRVMLKRGTYQIKVSKDGYKPKTISVTIPTHHRSITVNLERVIKRYSLYVNTEPVDAIVRFQSGVLFSSGSRLEEGDYTLLVSKKCYGTRKISTTLSSNKSVTISLNKDGSCQPPEPPKSECTKQLDQIERYFKHGLKSKALLELNRFDSNARNCTPEEQARANKF